MPYSGNERRRYKRFYIEVPIHITGKSRQGNPLEEDTYTFDISRSGIRYISTCDFDPNTELMVMMRLMYALGTDVSPGKWTTKAQIVRINKINKTDSGQLKNQELCLNFERPLDTPPSTDPWDQAVG